MDGRQERTLDAFQRILVYLERHPFTPEPPLLTESRHALEASIARIHSLDHQRRMATDDVSGPTVRSLRDRIRRHHLMSLVRIAKPLLRFAPGMAPLLRVPHARAPMATLAGHARELARALEPHADLLAAAGYGPEFLSELEAQAQELATVSERTDAARQQQSRLTLLVREEFKSARESVTVIEGMILRRQPKLLFGEWKMMRRVSRRVGRPRKRGQKVKRASSKLQASRLAVAILGPTERHSEQ